MRTKAAVSAVPLTAKKRLTMLNLSLLTLALAALTVSLAHAQQVYRIVGPDGKVTFSDKPPPPAVNAKVTTSAAGGSAGVAAASLPFELRQVASKYPVTLYTSANCAPCVSARGLLTARGIPFSEKTVTSNDDAQALQRLSGENSLPFATIGSQQLKGFSDAEWTQFLDAAGYPQTSVLPASYRAPAPTPLVAVAPATTPAAANGTNAAAGPRATSTRPVPAPNPADTNPAGIKF